MLQKLNLTRGEHFPVFLSLVFVLVMLFLLVVVTAGWAVADECECRKIKEYTWVYSPSDSDAKKLLSEGWQPYGVMSCARHLCKQIFVKYDDSECQKKGGGND